MGQEDVIRKHLKTRGATCEALNRVGWMNVYILFASGWLSIQLYKTALYTGTRLLQKNSICIFISDETYTIR